MFSRHFIAVVKHQYICIRRLLSQKACTECLIVKPLSDFHIKRATKDGLQYACKQCAYRHRRNWTNYTLHGWMTKLKDSAFQRFRGEEFDVTVPFLMGLWKRQNGKCYLSFLPMCVQTNSDWKCSIERLDNQKTYSTGNVALICQEFNTAYQWTPSLIDQLPALVLQKPDVHRYEKIFQNLHNFDRDRSLKQCVLCHSGPLFRTNRFCEQCKEEHSTTVAKWRFLRKIMHSAKTRSTIRAKQGDNRGVYTLSMGWASQTLSKQKYRCYYSQIPLVFEAGSPFKCSPERLDSSIGYTENNTRFICHVFNSCSNTAPKYNITGSAQWSREKMNYFLMHRHGFQLNYDDVFT